MSFSELQQFSELIAHLNKGAQSDPPWGEFLRRLRKMSRARVVALVLRRPWVDDIGVLFLEGVQRTTEELKSYAQDFGALDPFVDLPDGQPMTLEEWVPLEELRHSEYYQHQMVPTDQVQRLGLDVYSDGEARVLLRAIRGKTDPRFGEEEKRLFSLLTEHLRHLVAMLDLKSQHLVYESTLSRLAMGSILLDGERRVIRCSPLAQHLLQAGDGLRQIRRRLRAVEHDDNQRLQELLQQSIGSTALRAKTPQAINLARRHHEHPLHLIIRPVPMAYPQENLAARIAVLVGVPELRAEMSPEVLRHLFGLTTQEARLVIGLANGLNLEDVAREMGVSRNTVRTHLYRTFQKTGAKQQSALVSQVLRSIATLG